MKNASIGFYLILLTGLAVGGVARSATIDSVQAQSEQRDAIVSTLERFLRASYARDAVEAYQYLSAADRSVKTREEYVVENGSYSGFALELSKRLAASIELSEVVASVNGSRATVNFVAMLPDANHPSLSDIVEGFNSDLMSMLEEQSRLDRISALNELADNGQLALIESRDEQWELIREEGEWRVFVNWADAIEVVFGSLVSDQLGWEFHPTRDLVLAQPGQTIQMSYIAVNTGVETTTGKARHTVGAADSAEYLEIVACFCFLEQTLEAGESVELPLVFRVDYEVPESIKQFTVDYEFFLDSEFPDNEGS